MRTEGPNAEKLIKAFLNEPEETQFLEFKRVNGKGVVSKIIQTIIAFANTLTSPVFAEYAILYLHNFSCCTKLCTLGA